MFTLDVADILLYGGWAGKQYGCSGKDYNSLQWFDESAKPTEEAMQAAELSAAKAKRTAMIKIEANQRILASYPSWKQDNCALGFYDETETGNIKSGIQAIRSASNTAESDVAALETPAAVLAFTW